MTAAIVGIGFVGPGGIGREALLQRAQADAQAGIARAPSLRRGVEWPHGAPKRLRSYDRMGRIGVLAAMHAAADAGWESAVLAGDGLALTLGSETGSDATNEAYYHGVLGRAPLSPRLFTYTLPSCILGELSIHYRQTGVQEAIIAGRTSGVQAIAAAAAHIEQGRARRALAVATDSPGEALVAALQEASPPRTVSESACVFALAEAAGLEMDAPLIIGHASAFGPDAREACTAFALARTGIRREECDREIVAAPPGTGAPETPEPDAMAASLPIAVARALAEENGAWRVAIAISLCYSGAASALVLQRPTQALAAD